MYKTIKCKKKQSKSIINKFILTRKNIFSPILPFKIILILRSHAFTLLEYISYHSSGNKIMLKYLKNINIEVTNLIMENQHHKNYKILNLVILEYFNQSQTLFQKLKTEYNSHKNPRIKKVKPRMYQNKSTEGLYNVQVKLYNYVNIITNKTLNIELYYKLPCVGNDVHIHQHEISELVLY